MKNVVPPSTATPITCAERARMGYDRLVKAFGTEATKRAALDPRLDIDATAHCMVALASSTGSYTEGCKLMGINKDGVEAVMLGFNMASPYPDEGMRGSEYEAENFTLRDEFRALGYVA